MQLILLILSDAVLIVSDSSQTLRLSRVKNKLRIFILNLILIKFEVIQWIFNELITLIYIMIFIMIQFHVWSRVWIFMLFKILRVTIFPVVIWFFWYSMYAFCSHRFSN